MIGRLTDSEDVALARTLRDRGVPFDEDEFERMRVDALGLSIHQNWDVPSTVWSFPSCYVIAAVIRNDSSRSLSPSRIRFDGPPWQSKIALMKNPLGTRKGRSDVFGIELFGCGILLNRIISEKHIILPPGDFRAEVCGWQRGKRSCRWSITIVILSKLTLHCSIKEAGAIGSLSG